MAIVLEQIRLDVNREVLAMLAQQRPQVLSISPALAPLLDQLEILISGGKRLRPLFGYCGLRVAGGTWNASHAKALASLEFLQACALIHDDVMDDSKMRRGNKAVHEFFKEVHETSNLRGSAYLYGIGSAILLGDLCLSWADELLMKATNFSPDVKSLWDITRTELMAGQYLDLFAQSAQSSTNEVLNTVITYKSAKYTIERPMHIGAALVKREETRERALSQYAIPLGKAFQLRDDVLGVFGDESETGKPSGDDVREGKYTMLISSALAHASASESALLQSVLGNRDATQADIDDVKELLKRDALSEVESLIEKLVGDANYAVDTLETDGETKDLLRQLITMATARKQ
jgi:geranylgeranyl diphosphate synthase type I